MNTFTLLRESYPVAVTGMSAVLGAIIGSFLGVVAERVPAMVMEEESRTNLLFPASHCPVCQHSLKAWENIPIVSWLALRGRCSHCQTAIPLRLFAIELVTALFFGVTTGWGADVQTLRSLWLLAAFLLPLAMIDAQHQLLPDCLTQPLLWAGLLTHALGHSLPLTDALFGAVAGYLSLWLLYWAFRLATGREGLGYGDFKLLAALGAWCGWQALPSIVLLAALSGIVVFFVLNISGKNTRIIPFGPSLAFAGMVVFSGQVFAFTF
ncbi:prepilin peptidase [Citrobacter farmeri]|uniref:Prepilin leader peptidase/N-methyltransferase n=1 Tax=Citrobacter amalonaticus Y19 TaxID=1261127 RepID=A0A0F6TU93_CITAM|nr:A24 family peptidase [Citrobacter amalonaticus]AKE58386.1 general secretion pathway protein GspO [Citrobacter amalonaticus Y19]EKV5653507.1 prepilin peptidase [Citrobacter farmeri]